MRFPKMERNIVISFNFLSNHFSANLDDAADRVTSQSSERIEFYCDHEEANTKIFTYIKFLCDSSVRCPINGGGRLLFFNFFFKGSFTFTFFASVFDIFDIEDT